MNMAPIIPAGGKKMDWVKDPEQSVEKKAQSMFDDDPQLSAIKDLPGMQDGIDELTEMSTEVAPPVEEISVDMVPPVASIGGGAVEQAIEKVKDAAQGVADAAIKDVEKTVTDALKNVGVPVADAKVEEIKETPAEEKKEEHEKSETKEEEKIEEECKDEKKSDIPGVKEDKGEIEKEGKDKKEDKKDEKPAFAAATGMKRIAELSGDELKGLKDYWLGLGFPAEYVEAMTKKYRA
jgi:hypothetical protein